MQALVCLFVPPKIQLATLLLQDIQVILQQFQSAINLILVFLTIK